MAPMVRWALSLHQGQLCRLCRIDGWRCWRPIAARYSVCSVTIVFQYGICSSTIYRYFTQKFNTYYFRPFCMKSQRGEGGPTARAI